MAEGDPRDEGDRAAEASSRHSLPPLRQPRFWFWGAIALGLGLRSYLAAETAGTLDATVWEVFGREIAQNGLIATYRGGEYTFNHPPPVGLLVGGLWSLAQGLGFSFPLLLRLPFVAFDMATIVLLYRACELADDRRLRDGRRLVAALYALCPLAIVFSGFHGNSDSSIAFFLLAALLATARGRPAIAGAMLGLSLWIKIPGVLAIPALALALPHWRDRARFVAAAGGVAALGYLTALWQDPRAVFEAVFLYPGLRIQTTTGVQIWGLQIFYPKLADLPLALRDPFRDFALGYYRLNTAVSVLPIALFAWCRRSRNGVEELALSVAGSFAILYGLSNLWAFQYLAWSLPFWLLCPRPFAITANLTSTGYVYGLYAWLCGTPLLLGTWDFIGKPDWPWPILAARDIAYVFFLGAALYFVAHALRSEVTRWRARSPVG